VPLAFLVAVESLDLVARLLSRASRWTGAARVHGALAGAAVVVCAARPRVRACRGTTPCPKQPFTAAIAAFNCGRSRATR
jgi:hypothetical protein